jgi:hypothetical protein
MNIKKTIAAFCIVATASLLIITPPAYAHNPPHHVYLIFRRLTQAVLAPFQGVFHDGPINIKNAYVAEVWEQEKPEKRGKIENKIIGVLRAPGEETKGIVGGLKKSADKLCEATIELISLISSD